MIADWSMSCQLTGMPVAASAEPHRPGAMSRYLRPWAWSCRLITPISFAIWAVRALSKRSGVTYTTSVMFSKRPCPSARLDATAAYSAEGRNWKRSAAFDWKVACGRIWSRWSWWRSSARLRVLSANSISTGQPSPVAPRRSRKESALASGTSPASRLGSATGWSASEAAAGVALSSTTSPYAFLKTTRSPCTSCESEAVSDRAASGARITLDLVGSVTSVCAARPWSMASTSDGLPAAESSLSAETGSVAASGPVSAPGSPSEKCTAAEPSTTLLPSPSAIEAQPCAGAVWGSG